LTLARRVFLPKACLEHDELGILCATLRVVYDDLEVVWSEWTSSLMAWSCSWTVRLLGRGVSSATLCWAAAS